jgi:hypothetical protein
LRSYASASVANSFVGTAKRWNCRDITGRNGVIAVTYA